MWPKISIIKSRINRCNILARALDSLSTPEYPNLEVIVVVGASTDGTVEFLKERSGVATRWISEPDDGTTFAINKGFDMSTGEIYEWLDSDERYLA